MEPIDLLIPACYLSTMIMMWLFPPRWVKHLLSKLDENIQKLVTFAPRLAGVMARGSPQAIQESRSQAKSDKGIVGAIANIAELLSEYGPMLQDPMIQEVIGNFIGTLVHPQGQGQSTMKPWSG